MFTIACGIDTIGEAMPMPDEDAFYLRCNERLKLSAVRWNNCPWHNSSRWQSSWRPVADRLLAGIAARPRGVHLS